jgi:hypothetical protein
VGCEADELEDELEDEDRNEEEVFVVRLEQGVERPVLTTEDEAPFVEVEALSSTQGEQQCAADDQRKR